jgi:hypothetical protein
MQHEYAQLAERYVRGLMTPQQRESFEAELSRNPDLEAELRFQKVEKLMMETLGDQQLDQQMEQWDKEIKMRDRYRIAGLIAVIVSGFAVCWMMRGGDAAQAPVEAPIYLPPVASDTTSGLPSPQAGARESKQPDAVSPGLPAGRLAGVLRLADPPSFEAFEKRNGAPGEDAAVNRQLREIETAYQRNNLGQAIALAQRLLQTDTGRSNRRKQLLGELHLQNRDFEAAIGVIESMTPPFREGAEWNLLLCYFALSGKHNRDFTELYKKISDDNEHPAHDKLLQNKRLFELK